MPASAACLAYTLCHSAPHLCLFIDIVSAFGLDGRQTSNTMYVLLNFVEYAYIERSTSSIAYSRFSSHVTVTVSHRCTINNDCFSIWFYQINCDFAFTNGSDMDVCSLLPLLDANDSYEGKSSSRHTRCPCACII